jgi:hypothetical protein
MRSGQGGAKYRRGAEVAEAEIEAAISRAVPPQPAQRWARCYPGAPYEMEAGRYAAGPTDLAFDPLPRRRGRLGRRRSPGADSSSPIAIRIL